MGRGGRAPTCLGCGSLERHRAVRTLFETIRVREEFARIDLLEMASRRVVPHAWFRAVTPVRDFRRFDPQKMPMPDRSFGVVISMQVLNQVVDVPRALAETMRVLAQDGLACLSFAAPATRAQTETLKAPALGGDRRIYGADFEPELHEMLTGHSVAACEIADPVTGAGDLVYLVAPRFDRLRRIIRQGLDLRLLD